MSEVQILSEDVPWSLTVSNTLAIVVNGMMVVSKTLPGSGGPEDVQRALYRLVDEAVPVIHESLSPGKKSRG